MNFHRSARTTRALAFVSLVTLCLASFPSQAFATTCGTGSSVTFTDIGGGNCRAFLTSGTSLTLPTDWNSSNNTVEAIGGGGSGNAVTTRDEAAGGGGAYSETPDLSLTPGGSITYQVGGGGATSFSNGNAGGDTYFNGTGTTCSTQSVCAKGGGGGTSSAGGAGGLASGSIGTTTYSGGSGFFNSSAVADGGGGAAGPNGTGGNGSGTQGGSADNGTTAGPTTAANGNSGAEWGSGHGAGTGGLWLSGIGGKTGGAYGGGGTGSGHAGDSSGAGAQGIVVITYTPNAAATCTLSASPTNTVPGRSSTLTWTSANATSVSINNGIGTVTPTAGGTTSVSPFVTTTYTMTATGTAGNGTCTATVTVFTGITLTASTTISGSASVLGTISKGSGTFVIDDPLDPKNKLLYHSFVESPDVMNLYDGTTTLDGSGNATITLPAYFLALNEDFRYLASPLDSSMPDLHLSQGVHRKYFFGLIGPIVFSLAGGSPGGEISWQVTGIRHDPFILQNPIVPIVEKGPGQIVGQDQYLFPQFYAPTQQ